MEDHPLNAFFQTTDLLTKNRMTNNRFAKEVPEYLTRM